MGKFIEYNKPAETKAEKDTDAALQAAYAALAGLSEQVAALSETVTSLTAEGKTAKGDEH